MVTHNIQFGFNLFRTVTFCDPDDDNHWRKVVDDLRENNHITENHADAIREEYEYYERTFA